MPFPYVFPLILPSPDTAASGVQHDEVAVSKLATFIKDKPKFIDLVKTFARQATELETALAEVRLWRQVSSAFGAQLDVLGELIGQPREERTDEVYTIWIRARIIVNRSSGTIPELINILFVVTDSDNIQFQSYFPGAAVIRLYSTATLDEVTQYAAILKDARSAGINLTLEWIEGIEADTFRLDVGPGLDVGDLSGALYA